MKGHWELGKLSSCSKPWSRHSDIPSDGTNPWFGRFGSWNTAPKYTFGVLTATACRKSIKVAGKIRVQKRRWVVTIHYFTTSMMHWPFVFLLLAISIYSSSVSAQGVIINTIGIPNGATIVGGNIFLSNVNATVPDSFDYPVRTQKLVACIQLTIHLATGPFR